MLKKINKTIFLICLTLISYTSFGQNNTNSPYSMYGIGDLLNNGFSRNAAMGGVGTSLYSTHTLNPSNPATYASIAPSTFIFEVGLVGNWYTLKGNGNKFKKFDGNIRTIAIGFPITKWWKSGLGVLPISSIGYQLEQILPVVGDTTYYATIYKGVGGINSFYFDNSFDVLENLSVGAKVSYFFGSLDKSRSLVTRNNSSVSKYSEENRRVFKKFSFDLGVHYHKSFSDNFILNVGVNYAFKTDLSVDYKSTATLEINNLSKRGDLIDTLKDDVVNGNFSLPQSYSFGVSATLLKKLELVLDYQNDNWSSIKFDDQTFTNNKRYSFGLEYIPDMGSSVYWKLVRYRAGFNYTNSYLLYKGNQLKQLTGSFGLGVPLRSGALINVGFLYTHREVANTDVLSENIFQINLNFSFKATWFVKKHFY
jgi:hypothetical protein